MFSEAGWLQAPLSVDRTEVGGEVSLSVWVLQWLCRSKVLQSSIGPHISTVFSLILCSFLGPVGILTLD